MQLSVIVVNYNGRALLPSCLQALNAQTLPRESFEILVVDNGSTDESLPYLRAEHPSVRIIEAGRNLGFAEGNNLGARNARGDWLALINNDAIADARWLETMLAAAQRENAACVAAKLLNGDGTTIDFSGGVMNLWGRAFHPEEGWRNDPAFDAPRELFFACGGAMLVRRTLFMELGGFDPAFVAYFEDVDLGWRLRLAGHKIWYEPAAFVRHLGSTTGKRFPVEQRYALSEANALRALIQNYEEESLHKVLPLSLLLAAQRAVQQGGVERDSYRLGAPRAESAPMGDESEPAMSRVATALLVAMAEIADDLPNIMTRRGAAQWKRVLSDRELFTRFPLRLENFLLPWRETVLTQERLMTAFDVPEHLRPRYGSRLLIITHERVGARMAGPAIRAWEIAHALSDAHSIEVALACNGAPERESARVRLLPFDAADPHSRELQQYVAGADVVLAMGTLVSRYPILRGVNKPLIVDLYDPFELEKLAQTPVRDSAQRAAIDDESLGDVALISRAGDFYICASERQRDFWLGMLLGAGRLNRHTYSAGQEFRELIEVVPFGIPAAPPVAAAPVLKGVHPAIAREDKLLFWGGGLWEWFDPLTLLDALHQVVQSRPDVKLYFAAGAHFDAGIVPPMPVAAAARERARELGLLDEHVFFGDWIPYDTRGAYLLEADIGVSTHQPGIESRFASRTRLLDYVWAGVPILTTGGDPLAEEVARRGAGVVVPPHDAAALAEGIHALLDADRAQLEANVFAPWREELQWAAIVAPLARFLRAPALAPDAADVLPELRAADKLVTQNRTLQQQLDALTAYLREVETRTAERISALETHLHEVENGIVMRLLNKLKR